MDQRTSGILKDIMSMDQLPHRAPANSILLVNSAYLSFDEPHAADFGIEEIAHALAHICRFTGQCAEFYSVAQHSVLVSHNVPEAHAFQALLHDAAEAFIGDVAKPLKALLPDYAVIERRVEAAVYGRFGLGPPHPSIKVADQVLLRTEQRDLMGADHHEWALCGGVDPLPDRIVPVGPGEARAMFLARFDELAPPAHRRAAA